MFSIYILLTKWYQSLVGFIGTKQKEKINNGQMDEPTFFIIVRCALLLISQDYTQSGNSHSIVISTFSVL